MFTFKEISRGSSSNREWNAILRSYLDRMVTHFGVHKNACCGIDFRRSAPFLRRDVGQTTHVVECYRTGTAVICAFAMLKVSLPSDCMYVALMCSLRKGCGRALVGHLATTPSFPQQYIVLRSTDAALGFYLKMGFLVFNWQGIGSYMTVGDRRLTEWLDRAREDPNSRELVHKELCLRLWIEEDELEWPLMIVRSVEGARTTTRHSARLRQKAEACTFRC